MLAICFKWQLQLFIFYIFMLINSFSNQDLNVLEEIANNFINSAKCNNGFNDDVNRVKCTHSSNTDWLKALTNTLLERSTVYKPNNLKIFCCRPNYKLNSKFTFLKCNHLRFNIHTLQTHRLLLTYNQLQQLGKVTFDKIYLSYCIICNLKLELKQYNLSTVEPLISSLLGTKPRLENDLAG